MPVHASEQLPECPQSSFRNNSQGFLTNMHIYALTCLICSVCWAYIYAYIEVYMRLRQNPAGASMIADIVVPYV